MVKVITQETFDAVVKENVEEFGLELEEARKDAIKQFIAQVFFFFWCIQIYGPLFKLECNVFSGCWSH